MITCEKMNSVSAAESAAKSLGYTKLKDKQREVVVHLCSGNDVFAVLPTGYGKSLCYNCLPKAFDTLLKTEGSITLVRALTVHCLSSCNQTLC